MLLTASAETKKNNYKTGISRLRVFFENTCIFLDVLVCSVALYFYSLFIRARQNTVQLVKIYSGTTHQNI